MSEISVKLEDISKFYKLYDSPKDRLREAFHPFGKKFHREFFALKHINLEVKKGEILGIVGRNGAGKSTLLKLISGVIQPASGKMVVNGTVSALLELGSGLHPDFTGTQNIYFNGTMMGFSRSEMEEKVEEIQSFADINDFIDQPLKTYSSGMKARLGFALAVSINPEILIVDEVLSVGDELFRRKCFAKIEELFKSGCTVFFVSHSLGSVNEICSRAIMLDEGELILEGPPKFVTMHYQKYLFVNSEIAKNTRNEIILLNKNQEEKRNFGEQPEREKTYPYTPVEEKQPVEFKSKVEHNRLEAFYISGLEPKSTVVTKNCEVDITNIHMRTPEGKRVNTLVMNEEYIYSFNVHFDIDAEEVGFGVPFKTEKGLIITNYNFYGEEFIKSVQKGSVLQVDCYFKCILYPGIYFTNATVGAQINGKRAVLNRIVDAFVFKVQDTRRKEKHKGLVYCGQRFDIRKI